jgi:hypothetical protein
MELEHKTNFFIPKLCQFFIVPSEDINVVKQYSTGCGMIQRA